MAIQDFKTRYSALNTEQKKAVDQIEGPLMVIAGPGTGKTEVIALRIANILLKSDASPENILCLTFSDAGANAMHDRLLKLIGKTANRITVSTYHSFAQEIIQRSTTQSIDYLGYRSISEISQRHYIYQIQTKLPYHNHYRDESYGDKLLKLIQQFKQANLNPENLDQIIKQNLTTIKLIDKILAPLSPNLGRVSKKSVSSFEVLLDKLLEQNRTDSLSLTVITSLQEALKLYDIDQKTQPLSAFKKIYIEINQQGIAVFKNKHLTTLLDDFNLIYRSYQSLLSENRLYDYNDMILFSLRILKTYPKIKSELEEQYQYILLDEYQDTNEAQAELAKALSTNPIYEGRPNIMAVGDDDQAIYTFQGALHSNMLDFINSYQKTELIILKENYRSSQTIVDFSKLIANQISTRIGSSIDSINKDFVAATNNSNSKIIHYIFKTNLDQDIWIKNQLSKNMSNKSIAVIGSKHRYLKNLADYLSSEGIKINYERYSNLLEDQHFMELFYLLNLVQALSEHNQKRINYYLPIILNFDFLAIDPGLIWAISTQARTSHLDLVQLALEQPELELIMLALIKISGMVSLLGFDEIIDYLIGLSSIPITKLNNTNLYQFNYCQYLSQQTNNDFLLMEFLANIDFVRSQFKEYQKTLGLKNNLNEFIKFINELILAKETLTGNLSIKQSTNLSLISAHKAKGLEFDDVYLISATDDAWGPSKRDGGYNISLPVNLQYIQHKYLNKDDEYLRLLYVALSRSKNNLYLTSYKQNQYGKAIKPLSYLEDLDIKTEELSAADDASTLSIINSHWRGPFAKFKPQAAREELLADTLKNFSLSPSALEDFLDATNNGPTNFYYHHILKYPKLIENDNIFFGNAIHKSLEWYQKQFNLRLQKPSIEETHHYFEQIIKADQNLYQNYQEYLERGKISLQIYLDQASNDFKLNDLAELSFIKNNVTVDNVRLSGKIDRVILDQKNKQLTIVDYKTGRPKEKWNNDTKKYLRQLYFYKILLEHSPEYKNFSQIEARLDYVYFQKEANGNNILWASFKDEEEQRLLKLIKVIFEHIRSLSFPTTIQYQGVSAQTEFENDLLSGKI